MSSVFYLTKWLEDDDEGEVLSERYVLASHKNEAISQGRNIFGTAANFGCQEILEEDWNAQIALQCIQDTLDDLGSDALMLFALQKFPSFIDADFASEILCDDFPKSFEFALQHIALKDCNTAWIELAVEYQDQKTLELLLIKGLRDDGRGLAQACDCANRVLFDMLYPNSKPHKALKQTQCGNLHWIEERLAVEQKQRLHQTIDIPTASRARKI